VAEQSKQRVCVAAQNELELEFELELKLRVPVSSWSSASELSLCLAAKQSKHANEEPAQNEKHNKHLPAGPKVWA